MPVLYEYSSVDLDLSRGQAEALQRTGYVDVGPGADGRWRVTATSYVGTLVVDGTQLLIRPKINPENLFLLLEPGLPPDAWRKAAFDYETSSDLLPSMVAFFSRTVESTLGRGILQSYETRHEAHIAMRGRMDVAGQFKHAGLLTPVACTYDDFSENIIENRVLRAAIRRALRVPMTNPIDRQRLMRQLVALDAVDDTPIRPEAIDAIHITRLNQHYAPALRLARLLLANLSLADARGTKSASSFMINMNDLFQQFIFHRLRRALKGDVDVVEEPTVHLGSGRQVSMQPDLVFRSRSGETLYVGDAKYKLTADALGRSGDYYQLLAYTTAMDLPGGMLIYCRQRDSPNQRTVQVKNTDKRLALRSIDLTGAPDHVEREITDLADAIRRNFRR